MPVAHWFVSHSYHDQEAVEALVEALPEGVEPVVFPPITVRPEEFVSNALIAALLECDGLVYLRGGRSDNSFWVAFERDYALRMNKPVFAFEPNSHRIVRHAKPPIELPVYASYSSADRKRVEPILSHLRNDRFIDAPDLAASVPIGTTVVESIKDELTTRLRNHGYIVLFLSAQSTQSNWARFEVEGAARLAGTDRLLPVLLEPVELPDWGDLRTIQALQLYGDRERSATHRLDDLVVGIYWLVNRAAGKRELH